VPKQEKANKYAQMAEVAKQHMQEREELAPTPLAERQGSSSSVNRSLPRAIGKSRDPQYEKLTVYIRKSTRKAVNRRLLDEDQSQELSELIEELLSGWAIKRLNV
jgi:predicted outer membrane protein